MHESLIHDHDGLGEHEHPPRWIVYLEQQEDQYWSTARVEAHSQMEAVQKMILTMPVRSPFKAWAFPVHEEDGSVFSAEVTLQEIQ